MDKSKTVIIHGFDRSGSTVITKMLGTAEEVVLFMQPFNSGPIRKKMYQIWDSEMAEDEDKSFFSGLENQILNLDYIKSPWFEKHSTSTKFIEGKIHLIKTTINHFTTKWVQNDYPLIDQWAIWRDPMQILASLKRNDFITKWYVDAIREIVPAVRNEVILEPYMRYIDKIESEVQQAAFLIAVRSHFLFHHIEQDKLIDYHQFVESPQAALNHFTKTYGISQIKDSFSQTSHNLIGEDYNEKSNHIKVLEEVDHEFAIDIFKPLNNMIKQKFNINQ